MRKILSSVGVVFMLLVLAGCSTFKRNDVGVVGPGQAKAIMVDVVGGNAEIGKVKKEFHFGEMAYLYVTLGWDDTRRVQSLSAKWYDALDQVVASKTYKPQYSKKPHHVWFWINSAQLGKGAVRVEVLADGQLINVPFTVLEPIKYGVKAPWYQRMFKREAVDKKSIVIPKNIQ